MLNPDRTSRCGILYVDDEEKALKYFRMAFEAKYSVFIASSPAEGLEILRREGGRIGIVLSDQRMPDMQGAEFLGLVREEHPHIVRILTTAYSDLQSAIEAVNTGHIYQYVVKPWEIADLGMVLQRAADYYRVLTERNELLALKLTALQRIICSDRLRWLLLWGRTLDEPRRTAFHQTLGAFIAALPGNLNPLSVARAAAGSRQFEIGDLLRAEFRHASASLDALDTFRDGPAPVAEAVRRFVAALATAAALTPEAITIRAGLGGTVEVVIDPGDAPFAAGDLAGSIFGLLLAPEPSELALSAFEAGFAVALAGEALDLFVTAGTDVPPLKLCAFRPAEAPSSADGIIEALVEKFAAADIARL